MSFGLTYLGVSRMMIPPLAFDPEGLTRGLEELGSRVIACG